MGKEKRSGKWYFFGVQASNVWKFYFHTNSEREKKPFRSEVPAYARLCSLVTTKYEYDWHWVRVWQSFDVLISRYYHHVFRVFCSHWRPRLIFQRFVSSMREKENSCETPPRHNAKAGVSENIQREIFFGWIFRCSVQITREQGNFAEEFNAICWELKES